MPSHSSRQARFALDLPALLLAAALLFAQWSGLVHRVEHAWLQAGVAHGTDSPAESSSKLHHSCLAFDASAMADGIHVAALAAQLPAAVQMPALAAAFRSWDAPPARHFASRAPPMI